MYDHLLYSHYQTTILLEKYKENLRIDELAGAERVNWTCALLYRIMNLLVIEFL